MNLTADDLKQTRNFNFEKLCPEITRVIIVQEKALIKIKTRLRKA